MFTVVRKITFCYAHRLLNYSGKCRHLHGHNGVVEVELASKRLDRKGMVMDFERVKKHLQTWIDRKMDHKTLLHEADPLVKVLKKMKEPLYIMPSNPTAENIAKNIYDVAHRKGLPVVCVKLWETERCAASYKGY